jgi:hypothetical protein
MQVVRGRDPPSRHGNLCGGGGPQKAEVGFEDVSAISSNMITVPNFDRCGEYSASFEALQSRAVARWLCGTTAFGADVVQHRARSASLAAWSFWFCRKPFVSEFQVLCSRISAVEDTVFKGRHFD